MPAKTSRIPKYRLHKTWGLAVVRLNGRDIYLGKHGTSESQAEYRRVIAEWLAANGSPAAAGTAAEPHGLAMCELILAYLRHADGYYVKNGRPTKEVTNIKLALRPLVATHARVPVGEFGPAALKAVRQAMVDSDICRTLVNQRVNVIRRMFKWGVENQCVPATVLNALQAVAPLKQGRCNVRETAPVQPVPDAVVDATLKVAPRQIGAMIELQRLTGMRPGEVVLMRTGDIDTSGTVWVYRPAEHKTEHHGKGRLVHLGPQAQRVLGPHLRTDLAAFIFDPREVLIEKRAASSRARRTAVTPSERSRQRVASPKRAPGSRYTTMSYARAIAYACDQAFPHPLMASRGWQRLDSAERKTVDEWRKQHRWSPNRLRHNAATALRKQFGIEAARVVLGHSSAEVTEIYAEQDLARAAEIMGRVG